MTLDLNDRLRALGLPSTRLHLDNSHVLRKADRVSPKIHSAKSLQSRAFEPIRWVVPNFVAEGVTLLAGKPKLGKSWLCLDIAFAVANGATVFGDVQCQQGAVLYLALEDNERRLQSRMSMIQPDGSWPSSLCYATDWPTLDEGGADRIREWIKETKNPRLVIVDVFGRIRGQRNGRDTLYDQDYRAVRPLLDAITGTGIGLVIVHHTRKTGGDDQLDTVSGSTGLTGAMDAILVLDKSAGIVTLYGRGRDVEEIEIALQFDKTTCRWSTMGDPHTLRRSEQRNSILQLLMDKPDGLAPKDVARELNLTAENARKLLSRMAEQGDIEKIKRGLYAVPMSL